MFRFLFNGINLVFTAVIVSIAIAYFNAFTVFGIVFITVASVFAIFKLIIILTIVVNAIFGILTFRKLRKSR